ncbi:FAD-dependent oxidoreductase [Candidatus Uhrbacteria bacterium]|nr:FAD-dependent oxidoreductase [Candidatus Uhrbacteria bacterium]
MKKRVAVIGAGISGLGCAYVLQKEGIDVTVLEKKPSVGGRMSSRSKDGFIFDLGADHLCDLYDRIKYYCNEFGIEWEKMRFLKYALLKQGKLVPVREAVGTLSKLKLTWQFFLAKNAGNFLNLDELAANDTDNAYDYMQRWVGKDVADYYIDAFTSTYQFHRAEEISIGALKGILKSIETEPARWHLHRTKGGMQALPDAFASRLNVKTNHAVTQVTGGDLPSVDGESFDAVVLASQATASVNIYKNPTKSQAQLLQNTQYASSISIAFRVDRARMPDTAVVWVPYVESRKISGYINESMKGEELAHNGKTLLCAWLHEEFAKEMMGKTDEEIFAAVKSEILNVCPWFSSIDQLENHDLERWVEAMPKFSHGHLKRVSEFMQDGQGENSVFFCGDYMNGPWTEGALRNGERVAEQVIKKLRAA